MQLSLPYVDSPPLTTLVEEGVTRALHIALCLLPSFVLLRCYYLFTSTALSEAPFQALLRILGLALVILIVLVSYQELIALVDTLATALADYLGDKEAWRAHLQTAKKELEVPPQRAWVDNFSFSFLGFLRRNLVGGLQYPLRMLLLEIRTYLLLFSTLVGPLALVMHLLPGPMRNAFSTWLSMHLAFLFWGVTIALLDLLMATIDVKGVDATSTVRDVISAGAILGMYLLVGPLTSMYVGNMLGNAIFSASASTTVRMAVGAVSKLAGLLKNVIKYFFKPKA